MLGCLLRKDSFAQFTWIAMNKVYWFHVSLRAACPLNAVCQCVQPLALVVSDCFHKFVPTFLRCGERNFPRNEKCFRCSGLRQSNAPLAPCHNLGSCGKMQQGRQMPKTCTCK